MGRVRFVCETLSLPLPPRASVSCIHFNGKQLFCGTTHGSLFVLHCPTFTLSKIIPIGDGQEAVSKVVTSPSGKFVAVALSPSGRVLVRNLDFDRQVMTHDHHCPPAATHPGDHDASTAASRVCPVTALTWSDNGAYFLSGDCNGKVVMCRLGGYASLSNESRVIMSTRSEVLQLECMSREVLVSCKRGAFVYNIASASVVRVGTQHRNGQFGGCFAPTPLQDALSVALEPPTAGPPPLSSADEKVAAASSSGTPGGRADGDTPSAATPTLTPTLPMGSPPPRHLGTPTAITAAGEASSSSAAGAGAGVSAGGPVRRRRLSPSPLRLAPSQAGRLVLCSRPSSRVWVASSASGRVLCTLKVRGDGAVRSPAAFLAPVFIQLPPTCSGTSALDTGEPVATTLVLSHQPDGHVAVLDMHPDRLTVRSAMKLCGRVLDSSHGDPGTPGCHMHFFLHDPSSAEPLCDCGSGGSGSGTREASPGDPGSLYAHVLRRHRRAHLRNSRLRAFTTSSGHSSGGRARVHRHTRRPKSCRVHRSETFPSCLSSRTPCRHSAATAPTRAVVTCLRAVTAPEFLVRVGGPAVAGQMAAAVRHDVLDPVALSHLRTMLLSHEEGLKAADAAVAAADEAGSDATSAPPSTADAASLPSSPFVCVSGPSSVASVPTPDASVSSGHRTPEEWVVMSATSSPGKGDGTEEAGSGGGGDGAGTSASGAATSAIAPSCSESAPPPPLTQQLVDAFHSLCRRAGLGRPGSPGSPVPGVPAGDDFTVEMDDELELGVLSPRWSTRALLRQGDRLSGMFASLRNSLSALRASRGTPLSSKGGTVTPPRSACKDSPSAPPSSPPANIRSRLPVRSPPATPSPGTATSPVRRRLPPGTPHSPTGDESVVGTALEAVPAHIRRSIMSSLLAFPSPDTGFAVLAAHASDLSNLPLPLVSHETVTEHQALKDADRDQVEVNGVLQPPGNASATLAAITSLLAAHVPNADIAANAAVNVLKSGSRTSTGGDSFFAVQALLGDTAVITPTRGPDSAGPVVVCVGVDGHVTIQADNVFDVYAVNDFDCGDDGAQTPGTKTRPVPWLRLRVIITEEGSLVYTERRRQLSILALPPLATRHSSPTLAALTTPHK